MIGLKRLLFREPLVRWTFSTLTRSSVRWTIPSRHTRTFSGNFRLRARTTSSRSAIAACRRSTLASSFPAWEWLSRKRPHWRPPLRKHTPCLPVMPPWLCWAALRPDSLTLTALPTLLRCPPLCPILHQLHFEWVTSSLNLIQLLLNNLWLYLNVLNYPSLVNLESNQVATNK